MKNLWEDTKGFDDPGSNPEKVDFEKVDCFLQEVKYQLDQCQKPNYRILPGETILKTIEALGLSAIEFTIISNIDIVTLRNLIKGYQEITIEIANKLQEATNVPTSFWLNLEENYQNA